MDACETRATTASAPLSSAARRGSIVAAAIMMMIAMGLLLISFPRSRGPGRVGSIFIICVLRRGESFLKRSGCGAVYSLQSGNAGGARF